jgi:flagellar motility protein MotE (MotC chaperone)
MKKTHMIVMILAGIVSFAGSFATTYFLKDSQRAEASAAVESSKSYDSTTGKVPGMDPTNTRIVTGGQNLSKSMTEKQLHNLIYDIREKMKELQKREKESAYQEERIQTARDTLQQDIDNLDNLRVQLTTTLARLKTQEDNLRKTMVEITSAEKANMLRLASYYDKMDVTQSSKIMTNMATGSQLDDAVKIIHYMTERTAGKLLGEIGNTQPELASVLSQQLKRVKESP